jgi:hypothetical protein
MSDELFAIGAESDSGIIGKQFTIGSSDSLFSEFQCSQDTVEINDAGDAAKL